MLRNPFRRFLEPDVDEYLFDEQGEYLIEEIPRHWITNIFPIVGLITSAAMFLLMIFFPNWYLIALIGGILLALFCLYWIQKQYMMRICVTNMRIFNVSGVFKQSSFMLQLDEIVEIRTRTPIWGRIFGFGDINLVSAQGNELDLNLIANPKLREVLIRRTIQQTADNY